jgi:uncharacterized protein (TIGR03000 family)
MIRLALAALVAAVLPALASAQWIVSSKSPPRISGFGGGVRPINPTLPGAGPIMPGGGFRPIRPGWTPGPGNWVGPNYWLPQFGFGFGAPVYPYPVPVEVPVPVPVETPQPAEPPVPLSGESNAVLVLEFPADAEVWVGDKKGEGKPHTEWTLTSPPLKTGVEFTFNVKARWQVNGKTFEYVRSVPVAAGNRSKALVVAGTEVKE